MATVSTWVIGTILFSMMIAGSVSILAGYNRGYGVEVPTQLNATYNKLDSINEKTANMTSTFRSSDMSEAVGFLPRGVITTAMLVFDSFDMGRTFIAQVVSDLGLEGWVLIGLGGILSVFILFLVINAIVGRFF